MNKFLEVLRNEGMKETVIFLRAWIIADRIQWFAFGVMATLLVQWMTKVWA